MIDGTPKEAGAVVVLAGATGDLGVSSRAALTSKYHQCGGDHAATRLYDPNYRRSGASARRSRIAGTIAAVAKRVVREHPNLNVLANNVGASFGEDPTAARDLSNAQTMVTTNILVPIRMIAPLSITSRRTRVQRSST